jgi:hypothetical protein
MLKVQKFPFLVGFPRRPKSKRGVHRCALMMPAKTPEQAMLLSQKAVQVK